MPDLISHLGKHGPALSSDVVAWLAVEAKISKENAQKRLSRLLGDQTLNRLENVRFKNNVGFIYLASDFNSERFWRKLIAALKSEKSPIYSFITTTIALGGIVNLQEMKMLSAHPDKLVGKTEFPSFFNAVTVTQILTRESIRSIQTYTEIRTSITISRDRFRQSSF